MKKLRISNLSPTPLLLILAVAVLMTVPIRVFQLTNCVDPATGFWAAKDFTVPLLYIICAVICAVAFFLSAFSGIMTRPAFKEDKDILLGIGAIVFACTLIVDLALRVSKLITLVSTFTAQGAKDIFRFLTTTGSLAMAFEVLFGILAAIYLVLISISALKGEDSYSAHRILALNPVLWAMFRLICHFVAPVNFKNVSQLFLEIIMLCFTMVFFLSFARIASDINGEKSMWILWFTGVMTALMAFICALAPLVLVITGKGEMIPDAYPVRYCDFGLALFTSAFLFTVTPLTNEVDR
ncbi:MAG: hypothetical protein K5836_01275 [Clostridiales bacterium]|nr:hypothetical protein [Clostridiales bacterium]